MEQKREDMLDAIRHSAGSMKTIMPKHLPIRRDREYGYTYDLHSVHCSHEWQEHDSPTDERSIHD